MLISCFFHFFEDTPPVAIQTPAEPLKPLPPALTSSHIQVENVSPAPPAPTPSQQQQQQPVTVTTEPPKVTQTVDTSFVTAAQTGKQTSDMTAAANVHQQTLAVYSTVTSSYIAEQSYAMNPYQQTVQPAGGVTLTTNASFQASVGSSNLGSMASFHLPTQFQNQSYLPPTQGYAHFPGPGGYPNAPPPPLPPVPPSSLYPPPPSGINTLQNPPGYSLPPQTRPPHPPMSLPPPPLPPLHSGQLPPLPRVGSTDFQWPRQFGVPPTQSQQMGGWMKWRNWHCWFRYRVALYSCGIPAWIESYHTKRLGLYLSVSETLELWMRLFLCISEVNFQWKSSDQLVQVSVGDVQFIAKAIEKHGQLIKFSTTFWEWRFNYLWRHFLRQPTYLNKRRGAYYIFTPLM